MSETAGEDVGLGEAVTSYVRDVLTPAPHEQRPADKTWADDGWDDVGPAEANVDKPAERAGSDGGH